MYVFARPAQEQQLFDVLNTKMWDHELDRWKVPAHLLERTRVVAFIPRDAAAAAEHPEVNQDGHAQSFDRLPHGVQGAIIDATFESRGEDLQASQPKLSDCAPRFSSCAGRERVVVSETDKSLRVASYGASERVVAAARSEADAVDAVAIELGNPAVG